MSADGSARIIRLPLPPRHTAVLQLRIELLLAPRPVWRRLLLGGGASFWDLHVAIQDAFGWQDRHLHQFTVDDPRGRARLRFGIPDDSGFHGADEVLPGWEHPAAHYLRRGGPEALYVYDFGAEWQHAVELEGVRPAGRDEDVPRCLDGAGQAPGEEGMFRGDGDGGPFAPASVVFSDPGREWQERFGHD